MTHTPRHPATGEARKRSGGRRMAKNRNSRPSTGSAHPFRFIRTACLSIAALGLLLSSGAGQTQPAAKLVGNVGAATDGFNALWTEDGDYAQAFTTGGDPDGYVLTSVDIAAEHARNLGHDDPPDYAASIRTDSSGNPGARRGTLANPPGGLPADYGKTARFTASGGGIALEANTTYWVVLDISEGNRVAAFYGTSSTAEDSDGTAGWSLANNFKSRPLSSAGPWRVSSRTRVLQLAVRGHSGRISPSGGGSGESRNAAPEAVEAIGTLKLSAGGSSEVDLSARFTDPDGDELDFAAESSNPAVAAVSVDGETLTVRGLAPGTAEVTATATDPDGASATQSFTVTVTGVERVWHLPPASDPVLQGFVRVINHSDHAGHATVTATDDAGRTYEPLTLALDRRGAAHFNVHDLEMSNPAKGLTGATGPGTGGWRLAVESESLAVEALAYARAADGFLTPLDGTAPRTDGGALALATFNPGSNWRQVSLLRLVNPTDADAEAAVAGTDDAGRPPAAPVRLTVPAGTACTVDAAELESGSGLACGDPQAGLGDGEGKWRLRIESGAPLVAMGLLRSPTGHLSNLSGGALPAGADGVRRVHMFPSASDPDGRQGFVRFINRSDRDGTVTVRASDGTDADYEALTLALKAGEAAQFNSDDLEVGNAAKGLTGSTGPGSGDWTLALSGEVEFDAYAYVRSPDGFLAPMGAAAPSRDVDGSEVHRVAFLNPGGNWRQRSVLRLVNPGAEDAQASIEGTDDTGLRPGSPVRLTVPAGGAVALTSAELESGDAESIASGALGDGGGKWRLRIESDRPIAALSLATSPTGRLVNLSGADADRGFKHGLLPPPGGVALESPYECELLGRWDAAPGAPHAVDLLKDGARDAARSAERWTHPTRRWAGLCEGTYAIRVCALNAGGDCGPWSAESNPVTVD